MATFRKHVFINFLFFISNTIPFCLGQAGYYTLHHLQDKFPELESYVDQVAMDPMGFIWFGGEILIQRFDGYSIKTYPIRSMLEQSGEKIKSDAGPGFLTDSFNNFWVFSNIGLFLYQPACDAFTRVCFNPPADFFYTKTSERPEIFVITAMMEDSEQNIWIGLEGGLLFYFPISAINDLMKKGGLLPEKIWLPESKISPVWYQSDAHNPKIHESIKTPYYSNLNFRPEVLKLLQDRDGDIWINSHSRIFRLVQRNGEWEFGGYFFKNYPNRFYWTKNLFLDREKNLWIGVGNYLALKRSGKPHSKDFENVPKKFQQQTDPYGFDSLNKRTDFHFEWIEFSHDLGFQGHTGWIDNLYCANNNEVFVMNENVVLGYSLKWDMDENPVFTKMIHLQKKENDPGTFWKSNASGMFLSEELILFSGDWPHGAITLDIGNTFRKLYNVEGNPNSLPKMTYSCVYDLGKGRILIGGGNNNLYLTDNEFSSFRQLPLEIGFGGSVDNAIRTVVEDGFGCIWITNWIGQLAIFQEKCVDDPQQKQGCTYEFKSTNFESLKTRLNVVGMAIDSNKLVWIACDAGLYWFDLKTAGFDGNWENIVFKAFNGDIPKSDFISNESLSYMIPVKSDFYLMCAGDSVFQFDPIRKAFSVVIYEKDLKRNDPLLGIRFYDLAGDGTLWTTDLIRNSAITFTKTPFSPYYQIDVQNFSTSDGFPDGAYEFVADTYNNLWIYAVSSSQGMVRYQPSTNTFSYYNNPGIISGAIFGGLHAKDRSGRIYFGAMDGITVFHPDSIKSNNHVPPIRITDILINHKSIFNDIDSLRLLTLHNTNTLTLYANEKVLNIEFASLSYTNPKANRYAYFLNGFDNDTIFTTSQKRTASYSNITPGTYDFYVTGCNNDLKWSKEGTHLKIIVLPPWYATTYAYLLYAILTINLVFWGRKYDLKRIRLEHEAKLEHAEAEKLRELDRSKSEFFSNISHEFRTPLTLILGPLEDIINKTSDSLMKNQALMMKRNARRLLKLINQILDLSMLDAGKLNLQVSNFDLCTFLKGIVANFESAADYKHIELTCQVPENSLMVYFDDDKLEDVLDNLLENALKFTPSHGRVRVELGQIANFLWETGELSDVAEISVCDTGSGIPAELIPRVFDRFYQADSSKTRRHEGAGIGLSLVHELVKLHHGSIDVQSEEGKGTSFFLRLRMGNSYFHPGEIVSVKPKDQAFEEGHFIEGAPWEPVPLTYGSKRSKGSTILPEILVIENNADMRHYIINNLDHEFIFRGAEDGICGFEEAIKSIPDLIICDLMMPGMDGYELCGKLKNDERTRHIPIIILTARAARKNQIMGYECGADDYITKPFDKMMMIARIKNLLRERKTLREKFSLEWAKSPSGQAVATADEKFITRLNAILEKNYVSPEFGTRALGKEAGYSHSVLYRKLKALTNLSPNTYIRNFRLIKAHHMLNDQRMDVSTVAYSCGFNSLSYFSKCYKGFFHKMPHERSTHHSD